jgi:hypothetical protein
MDHETTLRESLADVASRSAAHAQAVQIAGAHAFNVLGYVNRRKLNQHATRYTFADGSLLRITSYGAVAVSADKRVFSTTHNCNRRA